MKSLREFADKNNLTIIELTQGSNGYPSNTSTAIYGGDFNSFKELQEFAENNNLEIITVHRRDGWHFWENKGFTHQPISISESDYGDNYRFVAKMDFEDFYSQEIAPYLEEAPEDFDHLEGIIKNAKEIWEQVDLAEDNETVVLSYGNYYETIKTECLAWSEDTHNWALALINK